MVEKAKADPSFKPTVLVKDFNIPQTNEAAWLNFEDLDNKEKFDIKFDYCVGGFDAADSIDLNAAKAICMRPGDNKIYVRQMYWLPQAVIDKYSNEGKRQGRDNVPYELWISQGYLRTCLGINATSAFFLNGLKNYGTSKIYTRCT